MTSGCADDVVSGAWGAAVRQPATRSLEPVIGIDGAGRAAYMYWNKRRLMIRWSGRDGRWRKPCVLADGPRGRVRRPTLRG